MLWPAFPAPGKVRWRKAFPGIFRCRCSRSIRSRRRCGAAAFPGIRPASRPMRWRIALAEEHLRLGHSVHRSTPSIRSRRPRAAWRKLAARHRAQLKIIECVCADETIHRRRVEARSRNIEGNGRARLGPGASGGAPNTNPGPMSGWRWTPRRNRLSDCWRKRSAIWPERQPCCCEDRPRRSQRFHLCKTIVHATVRSLRTRGRADLDTVAM